MTAKKTARPPINRAWHAAHQMPENATIEGRVAWHEMHAVQCGCRPMPQSIIDEIKRARA